MLASTKAILINFAQVYLKWGEMTGSKHNLEGNSCNSGEPAPGPYWRRMHSDWRFWFGAVLMITAIAIYV